MKKIFLSLAFLSFGVAAFSQDFGDVDKAIILKQPEAAKTALDKALINPKNAASPKANLYKGAVYAAFYAKPDLKAKYPNSEVAADSAFKIYMAQDTAFAAEKEFPTGAQPFFDVYSTSFDDGIRTFNAKKWDSAAHFFTLSQRYGNLIYSRHWSSSKATFDTISTQYAGYAYQNLNQPDNAVKYYKQLADNKVNGPDFKGIYAYLVSYYSTNKDDANFKSTLAEAEQFYPADKDAWNQYEMQNMSNNMSIDDIAAKYKADDAAGKLTTSDQYLGYAESFAGLNKDQLSKIDSAKQVDIKYDAADAYKKAYALQQNGLYAFNAGVMYYSVYTSLDDRFFALRGQTASLKTQRGVIEKQEWGLADSASAWLTTAYTALKAKTDRSKIESSSLNRSVDFLANIYAWKRDKSRGVKPADFDKYDALFKQYDAEHNKYKAQ